MEVSWPSLTDVKTNVSLSLKVISSHLYEPVSCPLYPWVAGTNLRLQTKVHDKQNSPYLTELHFYFEPSCHLDGGQVILVKTTTQFLSWGGDYAVLRQGRGNARQIQFLGLCLAVLPQEVWTSDTVSPDHTWSPSGPPSASPGTPALWASSHHTPVPIRCMLLRPQLSRQWKIFVGTWKASAAPGSSVRTHQAHLPGRAHRTTSTSTPAPVMAQGGPGPSHLLIHPRGQGLGLPRLDCPLFSLPL